MARLGRDRLTILEASPLFGGRERLRAIATSRQVFTLWGRRGVPWEVVGPAIWAQLSHSGFRPLHPGALGAESIMPRDYQLASQQLTRIYNERTRFPERWNAVRALLEALSPLIQPKSIPNKTKDIAVPAGHVVSR